jgi:hypothetical protein
MPGLAFIRIFNHSWMKRGRLFIPGSARRTGPRRVSDIGVISKEDFKIAEVLSLADDVDFVKVGQKIVIPTNHQSGALAIGGTVFNHCTYTDGRETYEQFIRAKEGIWGILVEEL